MTEFSGSKLHGRLCMVVAALFWSTGGFFAKAPVFLAWEETARGPLIAFWRSVFAALVLLPLVRRPRWRPGLIPLGIVFPAMNVTYLSAVALTTAANAIWLQSTAPWWVFLIGLIVPRQPVVRRELVPLAFAAVGVGVILVFEVYGQRHVGVLLGVISGVLFATVVVLMQHMREENAAWLIALCHGLTAAALLPWVVYYDVWPTAGQLLVLAAFGAVQMAIPYILLNRALRTISSQEAVLICLIEPVLNPILVLTWGERPAWWTMAGAGFILLGLLLRYTLMEIPRRITPEEIPREL